MSGTGAGGVWLLVAATHQARESLCAAHAGLTFRTSCMADPVYRHTQVIAAVPGGFKESQYFLEFVS